MFQGRWKDVAPDPVPDRRAIDAEEASASFALPLREGSLTAVLPDEVLRGLSEYFAEDRERERLALLTGTVIHESGGYRVSVTGMFPVREAEATSIRVAMTPQDWPGIWQQDTPMRDALIGWAHSHPGHGIFLSRTDLQTQALWFAQVWSLAMVFDPVSGEYGVFAGPDGRRLESVGGTRTSLETHISKSRCGAPGI